MAEPFHHRLGMRTLGDQERRARVAQVVEPEALRETRSDHRRLERPAVEVRVSQRSSGRVGKDEIARLCSSSAGEMLAEAIAEEPRHPHRASFVGLRRAEHERAVNLRIRFRDLDRAAQKIDATDPQCRDLARSEPGVGGEYDERARLITEHPVELVDLFRSEEH
ncbi:MAG TPA: hypothetical protein VIK61_10655, partial [Acidimicrobiia bacterium]